MRTVEEAVEELNGVNVEEVGKTRGVEVERVPS